MKDKLLPESSQKCYLPARFVIAFLMFCGMFLEYAHRVCLSVTIVTMVNHSAFDSPSSSLDTDNTCGENNNVTATTTEKQGIYIWSPYIQGIVLGAYFYGYVCSQVVGGRISEVAGGKWPFGFSIFFASLLALATPTAADIGVYALVILRSVMGLVNGICLPTCYALLAQWAPIEEQSTLLSLCVIGAHVGTILTMPISGYLCEHGFAGGWPSVYYIFGAIGCIWFIIWTCLAYSSPSDHPRISKSELEYIQKGNIQRAKDQKLPIPWRRILLSIPVWTTAFCFFTSTWSFLTLLTKLPTYLEVVLHIPIQNNGLINSMVYVCTCIALFGTGYASDYLRTKKHYAATKVRKGFQFFAMLGPAVSLTLIPLMGCHHAVVIFLLAVAMGFQGFAGGGANSITADMAPHHSATLFGFINSIASLSGVFAPMVAGILLEEGHSSMQQWGLVFYISAGLSVIGGIIFLLFASSERQPWAHVSESDENLKSENVEPLDAEIKQETTESENPKYFERLDIEMKQDHYVSEPSQ